MSETKANVLDVTIDNASAAYTSGDVIGAATVIQEVQLPSRSYGVGGIVTGATFIDQDGQGAALDLYLFDSLPTGSYSDNGAMIADDILKAFAKISSGTYNTWGAEKLSFVDSLFIAVPAKFYIIAVLAGAVTYTAADKLFIRLNIAQDRLGD